MTPSFLAAFPGFSSEGPSAPAFGEGTGDRYESSDFLQLVDLGFDVYDRTRDTDRAPGSTGRTATQPTAAPSSRASSSVPPGAA